MKNTILFITGLLLNFATFAQNGSFRLHFSNVVGNQALKLNTENYTNAAGENFSVSTFQYYISNIKLQRADGSEYIVPQDESYHLLRESKPESQEISLNNIPTGKYVGVSFTIGVDSLRNTMPVAQRTGCLDVGGEGQDMYWAWNSGYIFMKIEGTCSSIKLDSVRKSQRFLYHIGLFGGMKSPTVNNVRVVNLTFDKKLKVKENRTPVVQITADILKIFSGKNQLKIAEKPSIMVTPISKNVADNYAQMFKFVSAEFYKNSDLDKQKNTTGFVLFDDFYH